DVHPVTVAEFRRFVEATGYTTQAERAGESGVFDTKTGTWGLVRSVSWRYPFDPSKAAPDDHPVTQVSWNDAVAYCAGRKKRLPSELEWVHAGAEEREGDPRWIVPLRSRGVPWIPGLRPRAPSAGYRARSHRVPMCPQPRRHSTCNRGRQGGRRA